MLALIFISINTLCLRAAMALASLRICAGLPVPSFPDKQQKLHALAHILEDFENASPYFALFLQTVYAIEKLLTGLNMQPRIGMNQSLI